jgi:RimJ/RimL family protein N-acetyltransferase
MGDLAGVTRFFMNPLCTEYMLIPKEMQNPEGARQGLEILIQSYASPQPMFALTIANPVSDEFWGFCQLWPHEGPRTLELVYAVMPERQCSGIATEASRAVADYALSSSDVDVLIAFVVPDNIASVKVIEKLGFRNDGPAVHHGRPSLRFRLPALPSIKE